MYAKKIRASAKRDNRFAHPRRAQICKRWECVREAGRFLFLNILPTAIVKFFFNIGRVFRSDASNEGVSSRLPFPRVAFQLYVVSRRYTPSWFLKVISSVLASILKLPNTMLIRTSPISLSLRRLSDLTWFQGFKSPP